MKSLLMCLYLSAVAIGNFLVAGVNHFIQIPDSAAAQFELAVAKLPEDWSESPRNVVLPGYDGKKGTQDDLVQRAEEGRPVGLDLPGQDLFESAAQVIEAATLENGGVFPAEEEVRPGNDIWGRPIRYEILNSTRVRLISDGPDGEAKTKWDVGMVIDFEEKSEPEKRSWRDSFHPEEPWLERRKKELGMGKSEQDGVGYSPFTRTMFSGGQTRLSGAPYFLFFTALMLVTALLFIPYAMLYKPKTYLQD